MEPTKFLDKIKNEAKKADEDLPFEADTPKAEAEPVNPDEELKQTCEYHAVKRLLDADKKLTLKQVYAEFAKGGLWNKLRRGKLEDAALFLFAENTPNKGDTLRRKSGKTKNRQPENNRNDLIDDFLDANESEFLLRWWRGDWFEFRDGRGYAEISESEIESRYVEFLSEHPEYADYGTYRALVQELLYRMKGFHCCGVPEAIQQPSMLYRDEETGKMKAEYSPNMMCFAGKVVDIMRDAMYQAGLSKKPMIPHEVDSDFWSMDTVPYAYQKTYDGEMPIWQKFLDETLDMEEQCALQEMFGVCVSDETRWERCWFLHGEGGVGKGVTTSVLEALVGKHNISNVLIDKLNEDFRVHPITECKVNIMGDMPKFAAGSLSTVEGLLKNITGKGGKIDVNMKYGALVRNVAVRARFIFTTNVLPGFVDKTDGIWRRLLVIEYPDKQVPDGKKDPNLSEKIIANELPAIMAWAVEGLASVLKRGYPLEPNSGIEQKKLLREACNHEKQFLKEKDIKPGAKRVPVKEVYDDYKVWMKDNCYKPLGKSSFTNSFMKLIDGSKCEYGTYLGSGKQQMFIGVHSDEFVLDD